MSKLARLSLANRGLVALITLIVLGFGVYTIPQLKQQLLPSLALPVAVVTAELPSAPPEIVAQQLTTPIETAVKSVSGAGTVTSVSREGYTTVEVAFDYSTPADDMVSRLQSAVARITGQLPAGSNPQVSAGSFENVPIMQISAAGTADPRAFTERLRQAVVPKFQGVKGVRGVELVGDTTDHVRVTLDPAKAAAAGVTTAAVTEVLRSNGSAAPAGTLTQQKESLSIQVGAALRTVDDVRNLFVAPESQSESQAGGQKEGQKTGQSTAPARAPVRLSSVATVELVPDEVTSLARVDGQPSIGLSVTMLPDGNAVSISHDIHALLPDLQRELGGDAKLTITSDSAPSIEKAVEGLTTEGTLGLGFAVIVILVFLMSLRSTLVTALSIPVSLVIALIVLWARGYTLNLFTLGALTIAVGRVVDDSIVVLENIKRHLSYGTPKREAVLTGVREVTGAVVSSTLTTVAVFLPIAFIGGFIGQVFGPFAITITVALLTSLLVALTIVPAFAYWFLRPPAAGTSPQERDRIHQEASEKERRSRLQRIYVPVIKFATRRRLTTLVIGALIFLGTAGLATQLQINYLDQSDTTTVSVSQKMPVGTSLAATDTAARKVEKILTEYPEIANSQVTIGASGSSGTFGEASNGGEATFTVTVKDGTELTAFMAKVRDRLATVADIGKTMVGVGDDMGSSSNGLEVVVRSSDPATLADATEQVRAAVAATPKVINVTSNLAASAPRIDITVNREAAARYGLSDTTIAEHVSTVYRGVNLTSATIDGRQRDIVLRTGTAPVDLAALGAMQVPTSSGPVRLDALATVQRVEGPVQITHIDGARFASITGTPDTSDTGAVTDDLAARLAALKLPAGATYTIGGVSADLTVAFNDLGLALAAAVLLVFLIMAATFRSIVQPLILLVSVPFAATGAVLLLVLTGTALGLPGLIGLLMLIGIVVTNAIVLMDLINQYRAQGMGVHEAVVEGGLRRLRPILMTAVATICALSPMALGFTQSGDFISQPLAIVVIGGLISSTLLTLVLVPTLYTIVEGASERRAKRRAKTPAAEPAEPVLSGKHSGG
ncbi:HAE1 family hydrophobic/amphiphilic exporter-1 [Kibdelosporangium banguiense]|uniref:HAE1 family hydrophobic/amphiphilic exporter-1 n=1 Tax=Kibdelosporangium banguiense TaxID=1365924 RepID=A0ABS4TV19_9PSEU|nr:efflux RND transporter permease subunit [Kibdelosporangium banguiense]MBP2328263.1 HAE1 family hydrophobic/amphiphilic exporter-1 [Kibdelosporangium banguiense]